MIVDQIVDDPLQAELNRVNNRRDVTICCGLFGRRRNGHLDIICLKDINQDFLYMLCLVLCITTGLFLYVWYI